MMWPGGHQLRDIGMGRFCNQDRSESLNVIGLDTRVILELVHTFEIEGERSVASINLKSVSVLSTGCEASRLE